MVSQKVTIVNRRGLHARASAKLARVAAPFAAQVTVSKDGESVNASSIMGLMMLGAARGDAILIQTEGSDAEKALETLVGLVEDGFGEED